MLFIEDLPIPKPCFECLQSYSYLSPCFLDISDVIMESLFSSGQERSNVSSSAITSSKALFLGERDARLCRPKQQADRHQNSHRPLHHCLKKEKKKPRLLLASNRLSVCNFLMIRKTFSTLFLGLFCCSFMFKFGMGRLKKNFRNKKNICSIKLYIVQRYKICLVCVLLKVLSCCHAGHVNFEF